MPQGSTQEKTYLSAFKSFEKNGAAQDPSWLRSLRKDAISRFAGLGFPVARRGNEEWKYTNVLPIATSLFAHVIDPGPQDPTDHDLEPFTFRAPKWSQLVFVDGVYAHRLSSVPALPVGVSVTNLQEAVATKSDLVEQHLARHVDHETSAFTALNTAFIHQGAFVHIPKDTLLEEPIHLLFLSTARERSAVSHPRVLVLVDENSQATIIETYGGLSGGRYFTNAVTEVVAGDGAVVSHYRVQRQSEQAFHVATTQVVQGRDSTYSSMTVDIGGGLARNSLSVLLNQEGGACTLNGLYIVTGTQHVDNQTLIDHAKPHTTSRELYKGILEGSSRAVFNGRVLVRQDAQRADAQQTNKNLLLSEQAKVDTKPQLEIFADDVKCVHGAAAGQLDENALLYLKSRGIGAKTARSLMTHGFIGEVLSSIPLAPVHTHLDLLALSKLREQ